MPNLIHTRRALLSVAQGGAAALPKPPTPLIGPPGSAQLDLSWVDNARNEHGYKVVRGPSATGPFAQIAVTAPNVTAYSDTGLTPETTYYYSVRAFKGGANGPYSDVFSGTTGAAEFSVSYQTDIQQEMYSDQYLFTDSALTIPAVNDADVVGGWQSRTGTKHLIQAGADSIKPLLKLAQVNGFPSIRFDGSNDYLKALFTLSDPFHLFMVISQIGWTSGDHLVGGGSGDGFSLYQSGSSPQIQVYNGSGVGGNNGNLAVGEWKILELRMGVTTSTLRVNNGTATTPPSNAGDMGGITLGAHPTPSSYGNIEVAAFLLYTAELSATNRDVVVGELATRYGITL